MWLTHVLLRARLPVAITPSSRPSAKPSSCFFFFNDPSTPEIYTLSLHDALPIWKRTDCSVTWLMISYLLVVEQHRTQIVKIGRAVQQECRDRARMPSSA